MPAIDHIAHFHGSRTQVIHDRLHDVDRYIGRIMSTLQDVGIYDNTLVSLIVDHGLRDTERHLDLKRILEKHGLSVMGNLTDNDQFNSLYQHNAARGVSGNAFALLYFAEPKKGRLGMKSYAWDRRPSFDALRDFPANGGRVDLIKVLREQKGIELVIACKDMNTVVVFSRNGEATIEMQEDAISRGQRVLIVDDLLATGGTARATVQLVEKLGGIVEGLAFVIELTSLRGREMLKGYDVYTLVSFE